VSSWAIIPVLAVLTAWAVGLAVLRWAPGQPVSRRLGALLFVEGLAVVTTELAPPLLMTGSERVAVFISLVHAAADLLVPVLYLPFLGTALGVPLVRPFRSRRAGVAFTVVGLVGLAAIAAFPSAFVAEAIPVPPGEPARWLFSWGPAWQVLALGLVSAYTLGLVASVSALRRAQSDVARRQALIFLWAFGLRDLVWGGIYLIAMFAVNSLTPTRLAMLGQAYAGSLLVYAILVGYGILTVRLLDIDLKVRWTIKQGTVAAAFVAAFFFVSEGSALFLSNALGNLLGLLASALLIFALAPLQSVAERVATRAMPGVVDTPEYASYRKLQVYAAALESAYQEGGVTARERAMLERVAASLGLHPDDAEQLESDIRENAQPPGT
jgi:hypothetical protein